MSNSLKICDFVILYIYKMTETACNICTILQKIGEIIENDIKSRHEYDQLLDIIHSVERTLCENCSMSDEDSDSESCLG